MSDETDGQLEEGKRIATALAAHLIEMGAKKATIPVFIQDEKYEVVVAHVPVTNDSLVPVTQRLDKTQPGGGVAGVLEHWRKEIKSWREAAEEEGLTDAAFKERARGYAEVYECAVAQLQTAVRLDKDAPVRFRWPTPEGVHANGAKTAWCYGIYFPATDLCVGDMGHRGTGKPGWPNVEWIDVEPE